MLLVLFVFCLFKISQCFVATLILSKKNDESYYKHYHEALLQKSLTVD